MKKRLTASQLRGAAAAATFVLLYGCANTPAPPPPLPIVQPTQTVDVDPTLMTYCPTQPPIPRQKYSQKQSLQVAQYWQDLYTLCAGKQRKLVDLTSKAFNLQNPQPPVPASAPVITQ
jgi:hypothetical protein